MKSSSSFKPPQPSFLKFISKTKYGNAMFEVIELNESHQGYFKTIKHYKNKDYVYIPLRKIQCNSQFIKYAIYTVDRIKDWIYEHKGEKFGSCRYYLSFHEKSPNHREIKRQSEFLFQLPNKSLAGKIE